MFYITTTKFLASIPDDASTSDRAVVFYKDGDTIKVSELQPLFGKKPSIEFVEIENRDDMLVCLGALLVNEDACQFLDSSIPVPSRYADKISVTGQKKTAARTSGGRGRGRKRSVASAEKEPESSGLTSVSEDFMPKPAVSMDEQNADVSDDMEQAAKEVAATVESTDVENSSDDMSAEESEPKSADDLVLQDKDANAMYQLLKVRSSDIGFSWPTDMLMLQIYTAVENAENDEEIKGNVLAIRNGKYLWERIEPVLDKVKELVENS